MKKKLYHISNILMYLGIIVGVYGLYKIYNIKNKLPPGACPIVDNRPILYVGIALLVMSIILSFISGNNNKKSDYGVNHDK